MKLYDVPRNTLIRVEGCDQDILFHHIDGMYSYSTMSNGDVVHLVAWEDVTVCANQEKVLRFTPIEEVEQ